MTLLPPLVAMGGAPAFLEGIPLCRPATPALDDVMQRLRPSWDMGMLTNGPLVRQLEAETGERLGVRHVIAVASCTAGLMLSVQALAPEGGRAVLPSFTFSASAHALAWNGLVPVFAECDPATFQLDCVDASQRMSGASLIMATHVFGAPCRAEHVEMLGRWTGVPVIFDAAHAFGAVRQGRPIGGFGDAEVFSLSPTKPLPAGEGGLVATNHDAVAEHLRMGRDYGNPGDYDTRFAGLNARMSELHAAIALESLRLLDDALEHRRALAALYVQALDSIPGLEPQAIDHGDTSTYKDFTISVDEDAYGLGRDALARLLGMEGIETRRYFYPPVHRQQAYAHVPSGALPVTDDVASRVLSLPLSSRMSELALDVIVDRLMTIHDHAAALRVTLALDGPRASSFRL